MLYLCPVPHCSPTTTLAPPSGPAALQPLFLPPVLVPGVGVMVPGRAGLLLLLLLAGGAAPLPDTWGARLEGRGDPCQARPALCPAINSLTLSPRPALLSLHLVVICKSKP